MDEKRHFIPVDPAHRRWLLDHYAAQVAQATGHPRGAYHVAGGGNLRFG